MKETWRRPIAATALAAAMAAAMAAPTAAGSHGAGLVPSAWTCTDLGAVTFLIPPVTNPRAPFPGFLARPGTTYVVVAGGPIGGPLASFGLKAGLAAGEIDCVSTDFGVEVIVAPTGS